MLMIETSGEGGSAWLTPPLGGINSSLKEKKKKKKKARNPVFTMSNPSLSTFKMASLLFVIITYRTMKFNALIHAKLNIRDLANQIVTFMIDNHKQYQM